MTTICTNNQSHSLSGFAVFSGKILQAAKGYKFPKLQVDLLRPLRQWLDGIEISDPQFAEFLAKAIPAQCPFERDINIFGRHIAHIPPLCKLNPLYEELVCLRFRALCYLVDQCGVDIQSYC